MGESTRVVCLGAGFVSVYLERVLRKANKTGAIHLSIVNRENFHTFHGLVPEMVVGKIQPNTITSPARKLFPYADFYNAEVERIDWKEKKVIVSRSLDGHVFEIPYDHLVISLGTDDNLERYPGLSENAYRLRNFSDAFKLRNHIPQMLELAQIENDVHERQSLLTFVIAGGNYAGVEVACELAEYRDKLVRKKGLAHLIPEIRIIVLHAGDIILPELSKKCPKLGKYAEKKLRQKGIEVHYNTKVVSATPISVMTDHHESIPTRTIISCTGVAANPLIKKWHFQLDDIGRIITDSSFNVLNETVIWAGGDCAAVPHINGNSCPPLALYAMNAGRMIGRNILRRMENKPLLINRYNSFGDACSLSQWSAVGRVKNIQLKGVFAFIVWRICMFLYLPSMDRRIRLFGDYWVNMFTSNDIIDLMPQNNLLIEEKYYDKGQTIIKHGEHGNSLYFISEGEVDIYGPSDDLKTCDTLLATLKMGSHFGESATFTREKRNATAIAKTPVKLLELKRGTAMALGKTFTHITQQPNAD